MAFPPASRRGASAWPAVALAGVTAALVFGILLLASSWFRAQRPGPGHFRDDGRARDVDLWVGDLAPGVHAVLSSEWNDPDVDARYDRQLNRDLGLGAAGGLAYYRLDVFNTTDDPVRIDLGDGCLVLTPKGGSPMPAKSLAALLAGGAGSGAPASAQAETLRRLGAAQVSVEVPAGLRHRHVLGLERRVALGEVASVARADGTGFEPRRIPGRRWDDLVGAPTKAAIDDLARSPR